MTSSDARQIEAATAVLGHRLRNDYENGVGGGISHSEQQSHSSFSAFTSRVPTGIWGAKTFAKIRRRPESTASVIPTLTQDVKDLITIYGDAKTCRGRGDTDERD